MKIVSNQLPIRDMNNVSYKIVQSKHIDKKFYTFSDVEIHNLKWYVNQQNTLDIQQDDEEEEEEEEYKTMDDYLNEILEEISQPVNDLFEYLHPDIKPVYEEPIISVPSDILAIPEQPSDYYSMFSLELAACGMQKNSQLPVPQENFSLTTGSFGDDAGFAIQSAEHVFLGIADGAGGNAMYGYDPRLFSESLMRNCSYLAKTGKYPVAEPKRLLCQAFDRVQTENCFGSATACVIGIDYQSGRLHSVNIGDSGYVVLRQGYVVYRSESQAMNGDSPRQLDVYPWTATLKGQGLNYTEISSVDAICQSFELELNDIIILSTDGLFDNVPDYLIERILSQSRSLKHAAQELVTRAVRFYTKPDDILVIMARVTMNNNSIHTQ